ncbi:hypothetical protein C0J52_06280 [Blattella germanica]|nr:hypothetical protein C0J52_06280 [Blattella germanica]
MIEDQERTPLRTILQNFLNHIESLEIQRAEDSYEKEFQELKFFSEILKTSKQYSCSEGEKEVNRKKNRYKDILPFDNSRVILSEYAGVPGSDYINANYIKGASGSPAYIACQGPLPHTVNDFWRMVVECEVQVIVMACNEEEAGKHKCENYWVEREGEEKQFGMVAIRLVKASTVCPDFLVRTMRLKYTTSQAPHSSIIAALLVVSVKMYTRGMRLRSFTCSENLKIIKDAEEHGNRASARKFDESESCIRDWRKESLYTFIYIDMLIVSEERTVCQFHYSAWPDHGVPPLVRPLLDMVRLVRDTQASETLPVLVHCSAGCGRTGTICAIDYVWGLLRAGKLSKDFSLYKLVQDMRKQRIAMVQTKEQYVLVHQAVRELFREQLRMIDSHPYENIDANGMPLVKDEQEPMYASLSISILDNSNEEKQDGKEKEIPPLPQKKRGHIASSKQEKEVENLTEKQRSIVEQSSATAAISTPIATVSTGSSTTSPAATATTSTHSTTSTSSGTSSHKPRIAKLKALFERSPTTRESRSSQTKQRSSQQVSRSHSLGAMRIRVESEEDTPATERVAPTHHVSSRSVQVPSLTTLSTRPSLPIKRSKSLKVVGSNQRCKLSVAPTCVSDDSSEMRPNDLMHLQRDECSSIAKPFVPPKKCTSRCIKTESDTSRWTNCENSHVIARRRSLESVNFENSAMPDDSTFYEHNRISQSEFLDDEARRLLQDCKDYLVSSSRQSSSRQNSSRQSSSRQSSSRDNPSVSMADNLTLEAQRKVNAIIAGLGIRERRNSFRQAVGTGREDEAKAGRKYKDYEAIWPSNKGGVIPESKSSFQMQENHPLGTYMNVTDSVVVQNHPSKERTSNWFPRMDEQKVVSVKHSASASQPLAMEPEESINRYMTSSNNVRIGKLGIHPKQLSRNRVTPPERRLDSEPLSPVLPGPSNYVHPTVRNEATPPSLWSRKSKPIGNSGTPQRQDGTFYNVAECESLNWWAGRTAVANKVLTKEIPYKCSGSSACLRKSQAPTVENASNSRINSSQLQYNASVPVTHTKKPVISPEISYGLVAGVQLRRGFRDDSALCPSSAGSSVASRVRRHASVVLLRRSLAETGKTNARSGGEKPGLPESSCDDVESPSSGTWQQAPGVDLDTVAASISPHQGKNFIMKMH